MKLIAKHDSYGFLGRLHVKGSVVEVESDVKYPVEHFDLVEKSAEVVHEEKKEIKKTSKKH